MIHPKHLRELVIRPVLQYLDMHSEAAVNLLMGTAAQESRMGRYFMQVDSFGYPVGPALGIFQMEPATHDDIWKTYLNRVEKQTIAAKIVPFMMRNLAEEMIWNLKYATAMARIKYWRDSEPLPDKDDIGSLAATWKRIYNSPQGKGTEAEFVQNYHEYVLED